MIIVLGLLEKQGRRLRAEFGDLVLVWPRNRSVVACAGVEHVVLCTKFLAHKEDQRVASCYGRDRIRRVYGGESSIREELRRLLAAKS